MKLFLFHPTILRTARLLWAWLWGRYHVPQNEFLVFNDIKAIFARL